MVKRGRGSGSGT